ncbi:protein FAM170B-like isoform X2 [Drosophila willistoni]|uniref:protein FAM170B-like isoform X2 n=1 Tax=Drosophila willistoni TaxID=7260 RepID=UPI001F084A4F|nr:protein FAM170B-like isoform X2 [Drosophila willistoni]
MDNPKCANCDVYKLARSNMLRNKLTKNKAQQHIPQQQQQQIVHNKKQREQKQQQKQQRLCSPPTTSHNKQLSTNHTNRSPLRRQKAWLQPLQPILDTLNILSRSITASNEYK